MDCQLSLFSQLPEITSVSVLIKKLKEISDTTLVTPKEIYKAIGAGKLKAFNKGKKYFITRNAFQCWFQQEFSAKESTGEIDISDLVDF